MTKLAFILSSIHELPRLTEKEPSSITFSTLLHNRCSEAYAVTLGAGAVQG